jgi:biotin carboxyl carrier protein
MADIPVRPEDDRSITMHIDGTDYETRLTRKVRERGPWQPVDRSVIRAEIPGLVKEVLVRPGQQVRRGDGVVVLEAMKMANEVQAVWAGTVSSVEVEVGQSVPKGTVLVRLL